jgi:chromosome segregation ATPase
VSQSALESERSSAQAALAAERQSISVLTVALNEAKATSEIQSSKLQSLIIENEKLKSDCESLLSSAKEKESAHAALAARAQEAESALSLLETKKKRDLEFLRKQNENISALQRQIDELKAGTEDSESDLKAKVVRAERTASEATKQVEQLQTALVSSHQELELLRGKLAGLPRVNKEDEVEVISNYAGSLVSKPGADEVVEKLRAQLLVSEEEKIRLEVTLADTLEAKKVVEQALSLKVEELSRSVKSLSAKISALEEERERLEDELRNYQQSVRGVNNESGGYVSRLLMVAFAN